MRILVNKKGWIKVVEAFMAIVFLLGFVMIVLMVYNSSEKDANSLQKNNLVILNAIETQNNLRSEVFSASLPSYSNDSGFSPVLKSYLVNNSLYGENCSLYICSQTDICNFNENVAGNVYSSEVLLFANSSSYSPRKLKIFCYKI